MKTTFIIGCAAAGLIIGAGCGKKEEAPATATQAEVDAANTAAETPAATPAPAAAAPASGPENIPGENRVRSALAAKDYQGAVSQLIALQGSVPREKWEHYVSLQYEVRNALGDASDSDPKAAEALMTLNAINRGR
jgi:hypothetical protein